MNIFLFDNNLFFFYVEIFLSISILLFLIFGSIQTPSFFLNRPLIGNLFVNLFVICGILSIYLISKNFWFSNSLVTNFFIFDFVAVFFKILVLIGALLCILVSTEFLTKQKIIFFEYTLLLFLSVLGMFLLTNSYNVVSLFLSLELQSFCFYILASYKRNSIYSTEAGLKYFLLGGFSTAVVLFGSSLLYGFTGTINFQELTLLAYSNWYSNFVISLSTLFILTGFLFKLGAFPFYAWVPDVYEGSPTSTSIFFAVSSKAALIVIAVRFLKINCNTNLFDWQSVILICGVLSILVGSFLAVKQKKIKRVLAYSSISHIGYLLLAMVTLSVEGFYSVFFYLFVYMLSVICVWCVVLNIQNSVFFSRSINLSDLGAIFNFNNGLALTFLLAIFSMAGVPPLVGFYAKLSVFLSVTNSNFFFIVAICFLITVISSFFYVRLIKISFFEKILQVSLFENLSYIQANVLSINSFLLLFLFFNTSLLDVLSYRLALSL